MANYEAKHPIKSSMLDYGFGGIYEVRGTREDLVLPKRAADDAWSFA